MLNFFFFKYLSKSSQLFSFIGSLIVKTVTAQPIKVQSESLRDCNKLKCSFDPKYCSICCNLEGYKDVICVKKGYYYFCKCQK